MSKVPVAAAALAALSVVACVATISIPPPDSHDDVDGGGSAVADSGPPEASAAADASVDGASVDASDGIFDPSTASEIRVAADNPTMGIFDPSFVFPADATVGAMAYSAVPDQQTIRTHLAVSSDRGLSWILVAEVNTPEAATIPSSDATECPGGACTGNLISEVPSLIFDADDPAAERRWKLFTHRYIVGHGRIGTIALQTAPAPNGPWTAPKKLLGWSSPAPYTSTDVVTNVNALANTADCLLLTEPGALWRPGTLDLAVGCAYHAETSFTFRIELLRSTDHGASWQSVGTLLRAADASRVPGATGINAADLFLSDGVEYISGTPGDASGTYQGCIVVPIVDADSGRVPRDASGLAIPARTISPAHPQFSGACAFADGAGGYALDVGFLDPSVQRKFRSLRPGLTRP
jgi:hypothetical protein